MLSITYLKIGIGEAKSIVDAMKERVKGTWYEIARSLGVSQKDCKRIEGAFAYPGFEPKQVQPVDGNS